MDFKLVLDVVVALLLAATIGYAVVLNRRLTALRQNRDELAKLIANFNEATVRAESSIPKLRKAADDAGQGLLDRVEKAQTLRDDLAFMIERADSMANRLESSVRVARNESKPAAAPQATRAAAGRTASYMDDESDERSDAERELLRALQATR